MAAGTIDKELTEALDDLEALLKNGDVIEALSNRGVNASLALLAAHGLRAYLIGKKADAAEDLATAAEEIRSRLAASAAEPPRSGNGGGAP